MADETTYEVLALRYGSMQERTRRDNFIMADDHDAPMPIDYFVWLIRGGGRTILVDTGFEAEEAARRGRRMDRLPRDALIAVGVDPASVDTVVVTHLHYDHAGTLSDWPQARFHLQEAEMAYATGRCMCEPAMQTPFSVDHVCEMVRHVYAGRVQFHAGDGAVAPGVTVHHVGGHTKGMMFVRVKTVRGWVVLASDAAHFYENKEQRKPFVLVHSLEDMVRGWDRLYEHATSRLHVIPGHDPLVMQRYPSLSTATSGIAVRLDVAPVD
ncbi:MAG: N-acyl homoserine lactonase family protein [Pseudomonadota bacterium]